jgi:hypothetical protein
MAPFAICCNPSCDFFMDLCCDRRMGQVEPQVTAPCPICGWKKTDWCPRCRCSINETPLETSPPRCDLCGADLKETPVITDLDATERQKRLDDAVKCLDQLIVIIMERVAVQHRIDEEELVSECQAEPKGDNREEHADGDEFDYF